ncbi:MAG: sugar ABC transporter permease [Candidatus Tectimicrobiota bacterium]|nr:MAG: sugar ABC transporter permease [Candidatus Tectomicrobia bacterium]
MRRGSVRALLGGGAHFGLLAAFVAFTAFPFYWMLVTMFKETSDLLNPNNNPFLFNQPPTLEHLRVLFGETLFGQWLLNTAFVGVLVVAITLLLAVPAGYSLARLTGRLGEQLGIAIFLTYLVPPTILFIPLSRVVATLGLQDSLWSLVLVYPSFTVPFCTWLLMGFFKAIPRDLEEAAMIDGYSRFGAFAKVVIPISVAGVLTVVIFSFTLVMQEFVYALTFITAARRFTVSVGVPTFLVRGDVYFWGSLMGACFIASVPIAVLYNFFLDRFISGFTVGAVK